MGAYDRSSSDRSDRRTDGDKGAGDKGARKTRFRVMAPIHREGLDKPFWIRLGTAFENAPKNGGTASISVKLDALPREGELVLFVDEDEERENAAG